MFYKTIDAILEGFEEDGFPYFIVKDNRDICGYNRSEKDINKAADKLRSILEQANEDIYGTKYTVVVAEKPIQDISKVVGRVYKFVSPKQRSERTFQDKAEYYGQYFNPQLQALQDKIRDLETKLQTKQLEEASEEEYEDEPQPNKNFLGALMENPQIQSAIATYIAGFLNSGNAPQAVAGIPDDTKITHAIEILKRHDDRLGEDLLLLAQLAESDKKQFSMLLTMLRG